MRGSAVGAGVSCRDGGGEAPGNQYSGVGLQDGAGGRVEQSSKSRSQYTGVEGLTVTGAQNRINQYFRVVVQPT